MFSTKIIKSNENTQGEELYQHAWNSKKGILFMNKFIYN